MVELLKPNTLNISSYLGFIDEMRQLGEKIWDGIVPKPDEDSADFVKRLIRSETNPEPGLVPETTYWGFSQGQVVGRIALRHHLTEKLAEFGGHIGYEVPPSFKDTNPNLFIIGFDCEQVGSSSSYLFNVWTAPTGSENLFSTKKSKHKYDCLTRYTY